jgi:hypothetical protein
MCGQTWRNKKKRILRLFLPLYDLRHSYPLSFFRPNVLIYVRTFKTNATTSHNANSISKLVALRCDGTFFAPVRCVVDMKRHFAQNSGLFYRLPFHLLLLSTKILQGDQPHYDWAKSYCCCLCSIRTVSYMVWMVAYISSLFLTSVSINLNCPFHDGLPLPSSGVLSI